MSPRSSRRTRALQRAEQIGDAIAELEILFFELGSRTPVAAHEPAQERGDEDEAEKMADLVRARQREAVGRHEPAPERNRAEGFREDSATDIVEAAAQDDAGKE